MFAANIHVTFHVQACNCMLIANLGLQVNPMSTANVCRLNDAHVPTHEFTVTVSFAFAFAFTLTLTL